MDDYEEIFNLSYWRSLENTVDGTSFIDAFYKRFLATSDEVAKLFSNTNFHRQKSLLTMSLLHVSSYGSSHESNTIMERLAIKHKNLNIKPHLYKQWLNSLLETVKEYDPEYEEVVGESWRRILMPGIEFMMSAWSEK